MLGTTFPWSCCKQEESIFFLFVNFFIEEEETWGGGCTLVDGGDSGAQRVVLFVGGLYAAANADDVRRATRMCGKNELIYEGAHPAPLEYRCY